MDSRNELSTASLTPSVGDIVAGLRSTFLTAEFQRVVDYLTERDEQTKRKLSDLQMEVRSVELSKDSVVLENLRLKDERDKQERAFDAIRKENSEFRSRIRVLDLERGLREEDLEKKEREVDDARKLNADYERKIVALEAEKVRIAAELRAYEQRFVELNERVSRLEQTSEALNDGGSNQVNEPKLQDSIVISDDENIEESKRQRVEGNTMQIGTVDELNLELRNLPPYSDGEDIDDPFSSIIAQMQGGNERWKYEAFMTKDLLKDDQLCLHAICALHRWRIQRRPMSVRVQFFHKYDIMRITELVEMVIDGDPLYMPRKMASELERSDMDDFRRLALKFSAQLFNIATKKDDPYFPPPPPPPN